MGPAWESKSIESTGTKIPSASSPARSMILAVPIADLAHTEPSNLAARSSDSVASASSP